jgi:4-amino-4-deoxy-L-arabinose transferase-like glycosyltransferase
MEDRPVLMPLRQSRLAVLFPERDCPFLAVVLIVGAACFHLAYLAFACQLDLAPDEAHYWDWSRHLDWSYYSKGPLVAWLIRASCELVGNWSERATGSLMFAIRLPAVLCGAGLLLSLYVLTVQVFGRPRLALALVAGALTLPLVTAGSTLMTIDSPYTCLWGWALVFGLRAVRRGGWAWEATGLCVGLGILAKYTMVVFLPSLVLFLLFSRKQRRLLLSGGFWSMIGVTLLCCLPVLIWNSQHGWVTLLHVLRLAGLSGPVEQVGSGGLRWSGPIHYLGAQAALALVIWFVAWLLAMLAYNPRRVRDTGVRYLWWLSAPMFLLFLAFSLKTGGGEPNWPVTAYVSGGVLAAAWIAACLQSREAWLRQVTGWCVAAGCAVGLTLTVVAHHSNWAHPLMEQLAGPATIEQPYPVRRFDPTCRLRGWRRTLAARIDELRRQLAEQGQDVVIAAGSWSMPGELGVYCSGHPDVYCVGLLLGDRHSQYDYWPGPMKQPEEFRGRTFIIVGGAGPLVRMGFERVDPPIFVEHEEDGRPLAGWHIQVCHGFRGFPELPASMTSH